MKIIVKIPKNLKGKWQASVDSTAHINRNSPIYLWKRLEKKVSASGGKAKIHLKVKYGKGYHNEGVYRNLKDLKFAFNAFSNQNLINYLVE